MRKQTLRVLSSLMCLIFLASLFQAPLMAAAESIPVRVGNQTLNVTPGQWVSVRSGTQITHYNVRFVDGKPVALEMSQYTKLIFGDAGTAGASVADDVAQASSGGTSTKPASSGTTTKPAGQTSQSSTTPSSSQANAGNVSDDVAQATSGSTSTSSSTKPATTGSTSKPAGQTSQSSSQSSTTPSSSQSTAGTIADDVAQTGAGSLADDVAQSTSGSTSTTKPVNQSSTTPSSSQSTAGTIADDVAQAGTAGSLADDVAQSTTTSKTTTSTTSTNSSSTTTKTTWDPSKHPRDPQTGRFISQQEAAARGLNTGSTADDVAQAGSSSQSSQTPAGSTADDVAQAGQSSQTPAGSTADDVAQAGTAGSTADDVAQAGTAGAAGSVADDAAQTGSSKPSVGDKFRAGYETGKGMTNQGVQNVKDSLKSGFSAKNLLITAGITVGVDLATQIMRGEKPSVKKALKTVASAEFVGGVGGAVLGAAAGSFFVPFLSAVPVVGGVLSALAPSFGSIVGSSVGAYVAGDLKNGKFSIREAFKRIDWVGVTGQAIGSTAGAALGSCLGPVGTIVGGMVGGYLGNLAAQKIAGMFRKDKPANMPEIAMPTGTGAAVGGGMITIGGADPVISTAAPVSTGNDTVTISGNGKVVGDYESEVALAYSKYQELYKLYNDMLNQNRKDDALAVAGPMNQAKKEYDTLRTSGK